MLFEVFYNHIRNNSAVRSDVDGWLKDYMKNNYSLEEEFKLYQRVFPNSTLVRLWDEDSVNSFFEGLTPYELLLLWDDADASTADEFIIENEDIERSNGSFITSGSHLLDLPEWDEVWENLVEDFSWLNEDDFTEWYDWRDFAINCSSAERVRKGLDDLMTLAEELHVDIEALIAERGTK